MSGSSIVLALAGLFCILAAALDWDFFMQHRKAWIFVKLFGRGGARVFYGLLGATLIVIGLSISS